MVMERVQGYGASCWDAECSSPGRVGWVFKRNEIHISKRDLNSEVHCSPSHHSQDLETTQVSVQQMNDYVLFMYPPLFERLPFSFYGKPTLVLVFSNLQKKKKKKSWKWKYTAKQMMNTIFTFNSPFFFFPPFIWPQQTQEKAHQGAALPVHYMRQRLCPIWSLKAASESPQMNFSHVNKPSSLWGNDLNWKILPAKTLLGN